MLGSRTIKILVALLVSMTVGAFALMALETTPLHSSPQPLTAVGSAPGHVTQLIGQASVPLQPIKWRNIIVHSSAAEPANIPERYHFVIGANAQIRPTLLWKRQLGTPRTDYSFSVAVDASGNAFISGWTLGDLGATNGGETDTFLTKYDSDGNLQWTQQLARRDLDGSCSVAVDGAGNVFISGWTYGDLGGPSAGDSDAFLIKYDPAGTLLWTQQLGTAEYDRSDSVAVDAAGNVFISMCAQNILHTEHDVRYRNAFLVKYATPEPLVLEVEIDVKPGARSNNIDLNSNGVVSVAILGSENLDASEIDQETLEFAAASPKAKGKHGKTPSFRDVNGDSYEDLVVRFPAQDLDLDADAEEATLTGQLLDGTKFTGTDSVRIVGKSD